MKQNLKVSIIGLLSNSFLFVIKLIVGILSNSIALLSDAFHSLSDTIASIAVLVSVHVSAQKPDHNHHFGHSRAQPLAGLIFAIFAAVIGFEAILLAIKKFFVDTEVTLHYYAMLVMIISILIKFSLYYYFKNHAHGNPAIKASAIDSRNDILLNLVVLIAIISSYFKIPYVDQAIGLIIGIIIIKSGIHIGMENIGFLMGEAPDKKTMEIIKNKLKKLKLKKIKGYRNLKAHYIGPFLHIALEIVVNKNMTTKESHNLGEKVENKLEQLDFVEQVFVHIDYE